MQSSLIDVLFSTVEKIGVDSTKKLLLSAQEEPIKFEDKTVEKVVTTVAEQFRLPLHEIIYGVGRSNNRKYAIGFCVFYLKTIYAYELDDIAHFLNKHITICSKYCALIKKLNPKHISDKELIEAKNFFNNTFVKQGS